MRFGWMTIPGAGCLLAILALSAPHAESLTGQSDEQPSSIDVRHGHRSLLGDAGRCQGSER